jgi:hypothetical protein
MEDLSREAQSQFFLLRVWIAPDPGGGPGYRGKLQPVLGDGAYCFAGATELLALLESLVLGTATITVSPGPATPPDPPPAEET